MGVRLVVIQGKQRGKNLLFPRGEFVFGRGPECHVRPNSEQISRQHCILSVEKDFIFLRDLGSTNGTLVNGHRVLGKQVLQDGDEIQLGPLVLRVKTYSETNLETLPEMIVREKIDTLKDTSLVDKPVTPPLLDQV